MSLRLTDGDEEGSWRETYGLRKTIAPCGRGSEWALHEINRLPSRDRRVCPWANGPR